MKVIIAGSRDITDADIGAIVAASGFEITEVVSGMQRGVDALGEAWAKARGLPVKQFQADWDYFGLSAGPIRNQRMAEYADALIAIPGPKSRGTWDMVRQAERRGLKVYIHRQEAAA